MRGAWYVVRDHNESAMQPGQAERPEPTRTTHHATRTVPHLHAVTNDAIVLRERFADDAAGVMHALGARGALHLRAPRMPSRHLQGLVERLAPLQEETACWLVVCDRIDLALACGAKGAQLTSRSIDVRHARRIASSLVLGASVHTLADGLEAGAAGADWVVVSQALDPSSGSVDDPRGLRLVEALARRTSVPVIGIGGIRPGDVPVLRRLGAHGVAVIRGIWDASDGRGAAGAAIDYLTAYDAHRGS
jgi:thiazole tautomerase (transcriptional regulator TenI)